MITWLWILGVVLYLAFCLWRLSTVHGERRERALNIMAMVWLFGLFVAVVYIFTVVALAGGTAIVTATRYGEMWAEVILLTFVGSFGLWRVWAMLRAPRD